MITDYNEWKVKNKKKIFRQMTLYFDIDGTICNRPEGKDYEESVPISEMISKVNHLYDMGHYIHYYTARGSTTGKDWFKITYDQLNEWGCKFHGLSLGKPLYDFMVDDRTLQPEQIDWLLLVTRELNFKDFGLDDE
jgi:hypothetical protein